MSCAKMSLFERTRAIKAIRLLTRISIEKLFGGVGKVWHVLPE